MIAPKCIPQGPENNSVQFVSHLVSRTTAQPKHHSIKVTQGGNETQGNRLDLPWHLKEPSLCPLWNLSVNPMTIGSQEGCHRGLCHVRCSNFQDCLPASIEGVLEGGGREKDWLYCEGRGPVSWKRHRKVGNKEGQITKKHLMVSPISIMLPKEDLDHSNSHLQLTMKTLLRHSPVKTNSFNILNTFIPRLLL